MEVNKKLYNFAKIYKIELKTELLESSKYKTKIYLNDNFVHEVSGFTESLKPEKYAFIWLLDNDIISHRICTVDYDAEAILRVYCEINKVQFLNNYI